MRPRTSFERGGACGDRQGRVQNQPGLSAVSVGRRGGRERLSLIGAASGEDSHAPLMLGTSVRVQPTCFTVGGTMIEEKWQPKGMLHFEKFSFLDLPSGIIFMLPFPYPTSKYTSYLYCLC